MHLSRRGLLIGAGAAGGLLVAWALTPRRFDPPLAANEGEHVFNAWLKIGRDGVVTVAVPDLEMGQGITTLLPQIVATELGADWRQVAVEPAPVSGAYGNAPLAAEWRSLWMPLLPELAEGEDSVLAKRFGEREAFVVTADGTSLAAHETAARTAAAAARAMLAMAAAKRWNVAWEECEATAGFITHGQQRVRFADLVDEAIALIRPTRRSCDLPPQPSGRLTIRKAQGQPFRGWTCPPKSMAAIPSRAMSACPIWSLRRSAMRPRVMRNSVPMLQKMLHP